MSRNDSTSADFPTSRYGEIPGGHIDNSSSRSSLSLVPLFGKNREVHVPKRLGTENSPPVRS